MSHEALNWAFKTNLKTTQKFVLVALADYADEKNSCFPAYKLTADRVGASVSTVRRAIESLEKDGYLTVSKRFDRDGKQTSNRYVLNVGFEGYQFDTPSQGVHLMNSTPVHNSEQHPCSPDEQHPCSPSEQRTINEPSLYPPNEPPRSRKRDGGYTGEFEAFWQIYPRKNAKAAAFKAWKKLTSEERQLAAENVHRYASDPNRVDRFTPYGQKWLNEKRWEDAPLPSRYEGRPEWARSTQEKQNSMLNTIAELRAEQQQTEERLELY